MAAEARHRHLHYPVVAPAEQRVRHPGRHAHGSLHHLDLPRHRRAGSRPGGRQLELCRAAQIAVDRGLDPLGADAAIETDLHAHLVRHRRHDHAAQNGPVHQSVALEPEVTQPPAPPPEIAAGIGQGVPQLLRCERELEAASVVDDGRRRTHRCRPYGRAVRLAPAARYPSAVTERWFGALRQRDFRLFFAGQATSQIGTGMLPVALSFAVLNRHGSAGDVGFVLGAETLPLVLFLLVAGVVADRADRRVVMVLADVTRAGAQGGLAAWLLVGHPPLWGFLVLEAVVGTGLAFFTPAMTGLIPEVTPPQFLHQANALNGVAQWGGALVGPGLAGLLVAAAGPGWAVAVDAATYCVSGACLARLHLRPARRTPTGDFLAQLTGGWRAFRERTWLWAIVTQFSFFGLLVFPPFFVL